MNKYLKIGIMVATCLGVGYFSSVATEVGVYDWFPSLIKPSFNPPPEVFAPVWTVLYILMGVAAGLVWSRYHEDDESAKRALLFFAIQLTLNALWSVLFFALQNPGLALMEIVLLWLMIYETYAAFKKIDKIAGLLLLPYLAWVTFATVLNGSIWWLNR